LREDLSALEKGGITASGIWLFEASSVCSLLPGLNLTPSKIFADIYFIQPFPFTSFDELRQTDPGGGAHNIFGAVQNTRRFIKQEHVEKRARTGIVEEFSLNVDCIQLKMAED
jgi:hypothetical protein